MLAVIQLHISSSQRVSWGEVNLRMRVSTSLPSWFQSYLKNIEVVGATTSGIVSPRLKANPSGSCLRIIRKFTALDEHVDATTEIWTWPRNGSTFGIRVKSTQIVFLQMWKVDLVKLFLQMSLIANYQNTDLMVYLRINGGISGCKIVG